MSSIGGYAGQLLRVDLGKGHFSQESLPEDILRKYIGGTGLGAKYLYEEVPPGVGWSDPRNRVIIASGPLGGTTVKGSGTISLVTKGALTEGATSSQANGYLGPYLKFCGYDGLIIQGTAPRWVYLYVHDGGAELRDASHLLGKNTWETEDAIKEELGYTEHNMSVFGIGPAGENLVRFAAVVGDRGHVVAHNGPGAVLGSKKLKAIAVARGKKRVRVNNATALTAASKAFFEVIKTDPHWSLVYQWGMLWTTPGSHASGTTLVKNYLTNSFPTPPEKLEKFHARYIRPNYDAKPHHCWACQMHHCHIIKINEGPYAGYVGEEPEAEAVSAMSFLIGNDDAPSMLMLTNEVDRVGLDVNESGWVIAFTMEAYEKGYLTKKDTDGLEMTWGNVEAVRAMLHKIGRREGLGNILAEGVKRASQRLGGEMPNIAIYTGSGTPPRSHDHRLRWLEMFDACVSNTGTIENDVMGGRPELWNLPPLSNPFSPEQIATLDAHSKGHFQFLDSLGVCKFTCRIYPKYMMPMVQAATGWDMSWDEALQAGRRAVNLLRAFNIRHGRTPQMEAPSPRYGSTPVDGPAKGKSVAPVWNQMLDIYYKEMGWDRKTGKPLPETLRALGLESVAKDLWA